MTTTAAEVTPALVADGLSGGYGDIEVVHDVGVSVAPGRITALLGRNGAGKTTVLRLIAGISPARRGRVLLNGTDVTPMPAHRRVAAGIGFVQEGKQIFRERTVEENVLLGAYSRRPGRSERAEIVEQAYARFPALAAKRGTPAGMLSGGQQQMLAIAQALACRPSVIMLDEPTTGLAPSIVGEVFELLTVLRGEGMAVLLVEQAVDFCLRVADEVTVLNLGSEVLSSAVTDDCDLRDRLEAAYLAGEIGA